ncbi:hypothetical protein [Actinomyces lilanjuaniae]|uniref:hypothetical protein n=1 Tax=Actinomyces lilanjuaniae TaxID=2321394 RepID=UPI0013C44AFF|nr:hypothetical protein [Actinomyces lilanjuaniae]
MPRRPQPRRGRRVIGDGFGQVQAVARYYALRETPRVVSVLEEGRLLGTYSGINRRGGAEVLADLDYVFMPAAMLVPLAGRLVDSLVARDGAAGASARAVYTEVVDADGATRRLRVATGAATAVGRLTGEEVTRLLSAELLAWRWADRDWQLLAFPQAEFEHPPLVVVAGRPASQSVYAAVAVTDWEAQLVELLRITRTDRQD